MNISKSYFRISTWTFVRRKVSIRVDYCESFRHIANSYLKVRSWWSTVNCTDKLRCSYLQLRSFREVIIVIIVNSHWDLSTYKGSSRNSKITFADVHEGVPRQCVIPIPWICNISTITGYWYNPSRVFIYDINHTNGQNMSSDGGYHLVRFPRQSRTNDSLNIFWVTSTHKKWHLSIVVHESVSVFFESVQKDYLKLI